jgi:hypothetical protein
MVKHVRRDNTAARIQLIFKNTFNTSVLVFMGCISAPLAFKFMRKWSNPKGRVKGFQGMRLER